MASKDPLGDFLKRYERIETERRFIPGLPIYARIDGRAFSTFTGDMERPFDSRMSNAMIETTRRLVGEFNAVIGYTQSDEISLAWYDPDPRKPLFFDGRVMKTATVLAAAASVFFYQEIFKSFPDKALAGAPHFDARICQFPDLDELGEMFYWRELDARKNSVTMAVRAHYAHHEVMNRSEPEMHEMLHAVGVNWNDYPTFFKRGTYFRRRTVEKHLSEEELASIPEPYRPTKPVKRTAVLPADIPLLGKIANRADVLFRGAQPQAQSARAATS